MSRNTRRTVAPTTTPTCVSLGIDIAKADFAVAMLDGEQLVGEGTFVNTPAGFAKLAAWCDRHLKALPESALHACMEATGTYGIELAFFLHARFFETQHRISVVNPHQTNHHGKSRLLRNKTDRVDAENIAHFCATQHPADWQPPTETQRRLKELSRHLESIEKSMTREKNRLESGIHDPGIQRQIKQLLGLLEEQKQETQNEVEALLKQDATLLEQARLLESIKGVGRTTAIKFLAEVQDVRLFDSAAQLAAFAGLSPSQKQSGSSVRGKTSISKKGNSRLRTLLYMPIMAAMRHNPLIKPLTDRLLAEGRPKKVAMTAGMRKLLFLMFGVLKSGQPFDPNYAQLHA